jgi:hypothetical protein
MTKETKFGEWKPNSVVNSPESWMAYKQMLTESALDNDQIRNIAAFLRCKLRSQ